MLTEIDWKHIESIISLFLPVLTLYVHHKWCTPAIHRPKTATSEAKPPDTAKP